MLSLNTEKVNIDRPIVLITLANLFKKSGKKIYTLQKTTEKII